MITTRKNYNENTDPFDYSFFKNFNGVNRYEFFTMLFESIAKDFYSEDTHSSYLLKSHILNNVLDTNEFDLIILYCATGSDIPNYCAIHANWAASIQEKCVHNMNNPQGMLNKAALRDAYAFYKAVSAGQLANKKSVDSECLLWIVAILGNTNALELLDEAPIFSKPLAGTQFTPLMMATYCGSIEVVKFLLQQQSTLINLDAEVLFLAIERKQWLIAAMLINSGLKPTEEQENELFEGLNEVYQIEELNMFASSKTPREIELLQKENINLRKELEETKKQVAVLQNPQQMFNKAFLQAVEKKDAKKFGKLLDLAEINSQNETGQTALHLSVSNNDLEISDILLKAEPSLFHQTNNLGFTPIQQAAYDDQVETLCWLYEKNKELGFNYSSEEFEKIYKVANANAKVALANIKLFESAKAGYCDGINDALKKGAQINALSPDGETALFKAAYSAKAKAVKLLIDNGADPTLPSHHKETSLEALSAQHPKYSKLINAMKNSFLIFAAEHGNKEDVKTAFRFKADLQATDQQNETALHKTVRSNHVDINKYLIKQYVKQNLDIDDPKISPKTPTQLAAELKHIVEDKKIPLANYMERKYGRYKALLKHQALFSPPNEPTDDVPTNPTPSPQCGQKGY